ncbi:hypothetical protein GLAREA_01778 [Glarea lozoyensis ATCC 20868]|uniref:Uncharacterized protein n=1 Tax=Glarea lozoyensis (strain ATCC 20868 / MF5171) TaxID=1116229 RepID=S3D1H0_GLAL2|nr:uncharacterized protein GLAREA_01778 [Glarea lozoyensis ATCC 20868]EPE25866.1 hypothetical protein GLAREA_01778 [Glarea lozoyensis ATCC 20868]
MNIYEEWSSFKTIRADLSGIPPKLSQIPPYFGKTQKASNFVRPHVESNGNNLKDWLTNEYDSRRLNTGTVVAQSIRDTKSDLGMTEAEKLGKYYCTTEEQSILAMIHAKELMISDWETFTARKQVILSKAATEHPLSVQPKRSFENLVPSLEAAVKTPNSEIAEPCPHAQFATMRSLLGSVNYRRQSDRSAALNESEQNRLAISQSIVGNLTMKVSQLEKENLFLTRLLLWKEEEPSDRGHTDNQALTPNFMTDIKLVAQHRTTARENARIAKYYDLRLPATKLMKFRSTTFAIICNMRATISQHHLLEGGKVNPRLETRYERLEDECWVILKVMLERFGPADAAKKFEGSVVVEELLEDMRSIYQTLSRRTLREAICV